MPEWKSYRFRPVAAQPAPDEIRMFIGRLRRALRAAHGLRIPLRIRWPSGPSEGVQLSVPPGTGVRWMQFGLSSAYELGQWQAATTTDYGSAARPDFTMALGGAAELPLPCSVDESPWSETILGELASLRSGVAVEWDLRPDPEVPAADPRLARLMSSAPGEARLLSGPERALKDRQEARRTGLRWWVQGRILLGGDSESRIGGSRIAHLVEVASHLEGGNRLVCWPANSPFLRLRPEPVLSEAELIGLFPPHASVVFSSAPADPAGSPRLWLGRDLKGSSAGLPLDPSQGRHLLVLGETGMGKSSLVVRLAWQAARWGSVILFDPIGDTAREFLAGLPEGRAPQVSWVSPKVPGLTLSVLAEVSVPGGTRAAGRERLLGDVVAALRRVRAGRYADSSYWGPRLEEMLFQAIRAASHWPGASLTVAEQLLTPEGFAWKTIPEGAREAVSEVRRRIESAPQDGDGARRLLSEITRSEVLREMLDAAVPTWSVRTAVATGQVTVISGDAPQVGESTARYLLAVVLALIWNSVLLRTRPDKTFVILDEAQWYAHESVAEMLRLGRRFNLHLWAATQSLRSLPEPVRDAFTTNSADIVLFRGDPSDVREVSRWVPHIAPERVMRMPRGEVALLIDKGSETHWVQLSPPLRGSGDPDRFRPPLEQPVSTGSSEASEPARSSPEALLAASSSRLHAPEAVPLWEALRAVLDRADGLPELTVRLADLRARWPGDPTLGDRLVRMGGRVLSSAGAMVRTGKDGAGSFWILSRERLAELLTTEVVASGDTAGV